MRHKMCSAGNWKTCKWLGLLPASVQWIPRLKWAKKKFECGSWKWYWENRSSLAYLIGDWEKGGITLVVVYNHHHGDMAACSLHLSSVPICRWWNEFWVGLACGADAAYLGCVWTVEMCISPCVSTWQWPHLHHSPLISVLLLTVLCLYLHWWFSS